MDKRIKIIVLWLLLIVCMILHFDYHISKAVYGMDIRVKEASGSIPPQLIWIRAIFHFLPLLYIAMLLYFEQQMVRLLNLVLSGLYTIAHAFHFAGELRKAEDSSQMALLGITLLLSLLLTTTSFNWSKEGKQ